MQELKNLTDQELLTKKSELLKLLKTPDNVKKQFFSTKELKALGLRINKFRYKKFIAEVHERIFIEMLLITKEGFILPYRLGQMFITKTRRVLGNKFSYKSCDEDQTEYNFDTFGNSYYLKWEKDTYHGRRTRPEIESAYPHYNNQPIKYFKCFRLILKDNIRKKLTFAIRNFKIKL